MTREEQTDWLCRLRTDLNNGVIFTPWNKEFTEALNDVLEQEPTTKNDSEDEYVSRSELMCVLSDYYDTTIEYRSMLKEIAALPAVTPQEPRKGHWIKYGMPRCGEQHYKCTNCDEYFNFGLYSDYYKKAFKFCPNCGCRMVEPQESEEE